MVCDCSSRCPASSSVLRVCSRYSEFDTLPDTLALGTECKDLYNVREEGSD